MVLVAGRMIMRELVQRWARTCEHNIQCCSCWLRAFGFDVHETHDVRFLKLQLRHGQKKTLGTIPKYFGMIPNVFGMKPNVFGFQGFVISADPKHANPKGDPPSL